MKNINAKLSFVLVLITTVSLLAGCSGSSRQSADNYATSSMGSAQATAEYAPASPEYAALDKKINISGEETATENIMDDEVMQETQADIIENPATGGSGEFGSAVPSSEQIERKIVLSVNMVMQTKTFDQGLLDIESISKQYGGFVQDSFIRGKNINQEHDPRLANFTIRVPSKDLDAFVNELSQKFNVIETQKSGQDYSDQYYDLEARLKSLLIQEERLLSMLEKSEQLKYLIEIERELADVRYQIETLTSKRNYIDNNVALSTVTLSLHEVVQYDDIREAPPTFSKRIANAFSYSWVNAVETMQNVLIFAIGIIPLLILLAVLLVIILVLIKRMRAKNTRNIFNSKQTPIPQPAESPSEDKEQ